METPMEAHGIQGRRFSIGRSGYCAKLADAQVQHANAGTDASARRSLAPARMRDDEIYDIMRRVPWFEGMAEDALRVLVSRGRIESKPRYRTIIRQGASGSQFYVLLSGMVHCASHDEHHVPPRRMDLVLSAGSSFGEGALITSVRREATVTAVEPSELFVVTADDMVGLQGWLAPGSKHRSVHTHLISVVLESLHSFGRLAKAASPKLARRGVVDELSATMEIMYEKKDSVLYFEGTPADALFILVEGKVDMRVEADPEADNHSEAASPPDSRDASPAGGWAVARRRFSLRRRSSACAIAAAQAAAAAFEAAAAAAVEDRRTSPPLVRKDGTVSSARGTERAELFVSIYPVTSRG